MVRKTCISRTSIQTSITEHTYNRFNLLFSSGRLGKETQ